MAVTATPPKPADEKPATPPNPNPASPTNEKPPATPPAQGGAADPNAGMTQEQKDRLLSVYGETIQQQRAELDRVTKQLRETNERVTAITPPAPTDADKNKTFFDRPVETTRTLVREEISQALAPVNEFLKTFGPRTEMDRIKTALKSDPAFSKVIAVAEKYVDAAVKQSMDNGTPLSEQLVKAAALSVYGAAQLGMLPDVKLDGPAAPAAPANPNPSPSVTTTPPHLRPSAPPPPSSGSDNGAPAYEFSELERRVMREKGMSEEEYLAGLRMSARDVIKETAWPKKGA